MRLWVLATFASLAPLGCGSDLPAADAAELYRAANAALVSARQRAERDHAVSGSVEAQYPCMEGGVVGLNGSFSAAAPGGYEFQLAADLASCRQNGVSLADQVTYSMVVESYNSSSGAATYLYGVVGKVRASGKVQGDCELDVETRVTATELVYSGSCCGHDAADLLATGS